MEEAILNFAKQFSWKPELANPEAYRPAKRAVVCGMGGSHLATGLLKMWKPGIDVYVHRSYGLPPFDEAFLKDSLLIASSYSGNTEEVIDFLDEGYSRGYSMAVIATGGELIRFAQENGLPYVQMPNTGIQPRTAIGYALIALAKILNLESLAEEIQTIAPTIDPVSIRPRGEELADALFGFVPVIYASHNNLSIAYNWKIKFNETAKIPAYYNVFPELNHNEMTGSDVIKSTRDLSHKTAFIFLTDTHDHPHIQKRMSVCADLYEERGFRVESIPMIGGSVLERALTAIILADWTAFALSQKYQTEAEQVPLVEEFKKRIA